ncbi:hypothetical protein OG535_22440 [Kitasatospora sp. NBC_00085]|uniref:hypothetical protein n=1 Tax=unclassified Kitasatospora TaxID=2633591 RepID=UPI0032444907
MAARHQDTRRTLVNYAFFLACLVALFAGFLLMKADPGLTTRQILSNLGLSLIGSVLFALIFTAFSTRIQEKSLQESLKESFAELSGELTATVAQGNKDYLPIALYPALNPSDGRYGNRFNIDMTRSLEATGFYAFRGPSARYVAARLRASNQYPQQVKVAMLNPSDSRAIQRRAADRVHWDRFSDRELQQLETELRHELIVSIVSLFDYRRFCPVELLHVEDTAVYRYEMFDDSVYISWYHGPQSQAKEMPESLRFTANSFLYKTLRLELTRRFEISSSRVTFTPDQDDEFLARHLATVLGQPVDQSDIDQWRQDYQRLVGDFPDYLGSVYREIRGLH